MGVLQGRGAGGAGAAKTQPVHFSGTRCFSTGVARARTRRSERSGGGAGVRTAASPAKSGETGEQMEGRGGG